MAGFEMAPGISQNDQDRLRARVAELELEIARYQLQQRTAHERFLMLLNSSPVMMWLSGVEARFTHLNPAWLEFRGRSLDQEIGNGWTEGLHPDDRDLCIETYLKSFTCRVPFRIQYRLQRADGEFVWMELSGIPRNDDLGDFAGFMGSAIEVSDRKRGFFTPDEESVRLVFALTERERPLLVMSAAGLSTRHAAARLGISYKTADSHRSRILEKLGVHETASMVRYAIRAGLIEP